ncbi:MAG TPA: hypothetical protein VF784_06785 [Anaerolineales bacterium]
MLVRWLLFIHVLSAISFFLFHGVSVFMALRVRLETDLARIRALLDLSQMSLLPMALSFLLLGLTGIIMPFLVHLWDRVYIWLSIGLILGVFIYMGVFNENHYKQLRRLVGLPYMKGSKTYPAEAPRSPEEVRAFIKSINLAPLTVAGFGVPAIVLWLMVFKPF